ncbi:spermatogenesis-associated protein 20-like [Glandiceps talaboti]
MLSLVVRSLTANGRLPVGLITPIFCSTSKYSRQCITRLCFSCRTMATGGDGSESGPKHENRLAKEKSPYLLQHALNPVDWYPWGQEAFDKAKAENKLIFLSVGYSTCHWCHVMERESFENAETGRIMNEHFVCIKVDREERPDVDKMYMTFIQATQGGGGWPMSVWLTPDLKPVIGGTYFPPKDHFGRPGFPTILTRIAKMWVEKQEQLNSQGTMIIDALMQSSAVKKTGSESLPGRETQDMCYSQLEQSYDEQYGGFGQAPKFPQPVNFNALFHIYASEPNTERGKKCMDMALHTLKMMAKGGMHDHISQGFHRYSTDRYWHVPHFEKMLYDQGQLAVSYANAYQISKDDLYADIANDILTYVSRDLSDKNGGFYSAEDADSFPTENSEQRKEGAFCVWTDKDIKYLLSDNVPGNDSVKLSDVFIKHYGVSQSGNVSFEHDPHGELQNQNVLIIRGEIEDTASVCKVDVTTARDALTKCRDILYRERQKRPKPHLDNKMITAWNGLMMSGFAKAGQLLPSSNYTQRALEAANFIKTYMYDAATGCLLRSCYAGQSGDVTQIATPINGFVDDYAFLIRGLLDLYEACYDDAWLEWAAQLQHKQDELFLDTEGAAYFTVTDGDQNILVRMKEDQDGAEPSGNSVSAMNLLRLSNYLDNKDLYDKAVALLTVFGDRLRKIPMALPEMVCASMYQQSSPKQIIIRGERDAEDTKQLLECVHSFYIPNKILILADGNTDSYLYKTLELLPTLDKVEGKATAYVCENYACKLPVTTLEELEKLLADQ